MNKKIIIIVIALIIIASGVYVAWIFQRSLFGGGEDCLSKNNALVVIYRYAQPAKETFQFISYVLSEVIRSNSSNSINIQFTLCYMDFHSIPADIRQELETRFDFYPIFVLNSADLDIAKAPVLDTLFDRLGNSIYVPKYVPLKELYYITLNYLLQNYNQAYLTEVNGVYALIATLQRPATNTSVNPIVGSPDARFYIYIYEDVYCPVCALLYQNTLPKLWNMVNNGTAALVLKNFIVHPQAYSAQQYLTAVFLKTGNSSLVVEVMKSVYDKLLQDLRQNKTPSIDIRAIVTEKLGHEVDVQGYATPASNVIESDGWEAFNYLILGTPGIVVWDNENGVGLVIVGFISAEDIVKVMDFLAKLD